MGQARMQRPQRMQALSWGSMASWPRQRMPEQPLVTGMSVREMAMPIMGPPYMYSEVFFISLNKELSFSSPSIINNPLKIL